VAGDFLTYVQTCQADTVAHPASSPREQCSERDPDLHLRLALRLRWVE